MASLPRSTFYFIIISLTLLHSQTLPKTSFSQSVIFHFPPFSHESFALAGTSIIQNGVLWLTGSDGSLPSTTSFGAALFHYPIAITPLASFSTSFTFLIVNPNLDSPEDNFIAFFLTPESSIHDPPDDIKNGSIYFLEFLGFKHLKSIDSNPITAWIGIDYREGAMKTRVSVGDPGITIREERQISNSNHFVEQMIYTGFASSTKNSTVSHAIESWNLSSSTKITDATLHTASRIEIPSNKAPSSAPNLLGNLVKAAVLAASAVALLFACVNVKEQFHRRLGRRNASERFPKFDFRAVVEGTRNFDEEIGEGGTSIIYKMTLPGSSAAYAVKRFRADENSRQWFQIEFEVVTHIRHENILELKGWCRTDAGEYLLIYDFMSQDSLKSIFHSRDPPFFPWAKRYAIAMKLASALRYLHDDCSPFVLHGDVKSGNVLLNEEYEPKLADFGLSLRGPPYKAIGKSEHYSAPECEPDSELDARADVYSYGVLALEICTGQLPNELVNHVRGLQLNGRILEVADWRLRGRFDRDEMLKLLQVGLACAVEEKERRPSMALVLKVLEGKAGVDELRQG